MDQVMFKKKNVLITGANGFIGQHLVKRLRETNVHLVLLVKNKEKAKQFESFENVTIIQGKLGELAHLHLQLEQEGLVSIDSVIHLAWEGNSGSTRGDENLQINNVKATTQLINEVKKLGCQKFIGIGTVSEQLVLESELDVACANMIYASAKLSTYYMSRVLCKEKNIKFVWCQLANVYGPGNETGNLMSYTLKSLLNHQKPTYSSAQVWQDFIYIDDCIEALLMILFNDNKQDHYYIGTGKPKKLKEYLMIARDVISPDMELGIGERSDDGLIYKKEWFTIQKLEEEYQYHTKVSFEEGIRKTVEMEN